LSFEDDNAVMKPVIRTFNSHEEAEAFLLAERKALSPQERIELCFQVSMQVWQLHHPDTPTSSLRENPRIEVRDRRGAND
jgi:hypothetical protein